MTVLTEDNKQFATGNGVTTTFNFTYRCLLESHLQIYIDEVLRPGNEYEVTIDADGVGGSVEFDDPPEDGAQVLIYRYVDYTQESALPIEDDFQQTTLENAIDKLTIECQQLQEQLNRAAKSSLFEETVVNIVLPIPASRRALLWHPSEDGRLINSTYDPDELYEQAAAALAEVAALVADAEAAAAAAQAAQAAAEAAASNAETTVNNVNNGFPGIANWSVNNDIGDLLVWDEVAPTVFGFRNLGAGTNGQVLTSNGGSAVPSWETVSGGGLTAFVIFEPTNVNGAANIINSENVLSVTRTGAGVYDIVFDGDFASNNEPFVGIMTGNQIDSPGAHITISQSSTNTITLRARTLQVNVDFMGETADLEIAAISDLSWDAGQYLGVLAFTSLN